MCVRDGRERRDNNLAGRRKDGGSERGEDGWSAVGGKREKPQRNKRPSGLIRRQIGCRAQLGGERESLAVWEDLVSSALIFQPACPCLYNSERVKANAAPETTVHWVMDGAPLSIFMYFYYPSGQ